jgi:hypothetical protein
MIRALGLAALVVAAIGVLWMRSCSGPRARLVSAAMQGEVALVVVANDDDGEGEVQVDVRAWPPDGGAPLLKSQKAVLRRGDEGRVPVRMEGARGDERLEVQVDYPPR